MKNRRAWLAMAGFGIPFAAAPAHAQEIELTGPLAGAPAARSSSSPNPGSKITDDFLLPSGQLEVGGEVVFLTSDEADRELELTDVGLLRLRARRAVGDFVELFIRTEQVQSSLLAKPSIGRWARFELALGHAITKLDIDQDPRPFWLEEVVAHAEAQLGEREFAAWLGVDYSLPVATGPDAPSRTSVRFLDPNVGLSLHIGGVISPRKSSWDLFAIYSVVDRGDLERPATTLPILDGGFDQRQLAIGVQHRFGAESADDE